MRQNISIILLFVSLFSFFIGCVDDDDPVATIEERYHLSKIFKNDLLVARFIYSNYRLDTIVQYSWTDADSTKISDSSTISITYRGDYIDRYHFVRTNVVDSALTEKLETQIESNKKSIDTLNVELVQIETTLKSLQNDSLTKLQETINSGHLSAQAIIESLKNDSTELYETFNDILLISTDLRTQEQIDFVLNFNDTITFIKDQIIAAIEQKKADSLSLWNDYNKYASEIQDEIDMLSQSELGIKMDSLNTEIESLKEDIDENVASTTSYLIEVFYHDDYPDLIHYLDYRKFMTDSTNNSYLLTQYRVSYQYNEAKKITEEYRYQVYNNSVEPVEFDQIAYDSEGNINSKERYRIDPGRNVDQLTNIFSYLHDDNVNPFRFLHVLPDSLLVFQGYNMLSQNNIKELRKKDELGNPLPKESYYSNITYNAHNYPAIEERYSFDPLAEKEVFEYEYLGSPEIIAY